MTRDLTWLLVVILVGALIFLTAGIWALWVGLRRSVKVLNLSSNKRGHPRLRHRQVISQLSTEDHLTPGKPVSLVREDQPAWFSPLFMALLAILFAWVVLGVLQIAGLFARLSTVDQNGLIFYGQSLVLPVLALGLMVLLLARANELNPDVHEYQKNERAQILLIGASSGVGMWLAAMFLERILAVWIPAGLNGSDVFKSSAVVVQWVDLFKIGLLGDLPAPGGTAGAWITLLFVVLISPAVAEWFFRGYVLPLWAERWGWTGGLVGSALLSAVFSLNILGLPAMFLSGIGMGWLARYGWQHGSCVDAAGASPDQNNKGIFKRFPEHLLGAWSAHTIFNLLMVVAWLWH